MEHGWENVPNCERFSLTEKKGLFLSVYVDDIKLAGKEAEHQTDLEKYSCKTLVLENRHHSLTMFIWVALKENARLARILWIFLQVCLNLEFLLGLWKAALFKETWRKKILMVSKSCKEMREKILRTGE